MVYFRLVLITSIECCFLASEKSENSGAVMFCKNKKIVCAFCDLTTLIFTKVLFSSPSTPGRPFCLCSDNLC